MELSKYLSLLQELNYPSIVDITDDQMTDIFSSQNRQFLLTWIIKNLNSKFKIPDAWTQSTESEFASFFYENGFCTSSQKMSLVQGDEHLTMKELITIFDRIFYLLKNNQKENCKPNPCGNETEDLELFLKKDLNLFPAFGPIKVYSAQERETKRKDIESKIKELKCSLNQAHVNADICNNDMCDNEDINVEDNIESFKKHAKKLQEIGLAIQMVSKEDTVDDIGFKSNFQDYVMECNKEISDILQYFQVTKLISMVGDVTKDKQEQKGFRQYLPTVEIYKQLQQIMKYEKDQMFKFCNK